MARPLAALLLATLLVGACTRPTGPTAPLAREQLAASAGLETAIVRDTAERFIRAYAGASRDDARELAGLVTGPKLVAWVHWLAVQNREFDGTITGEPDVRAIAFVQELRAGGTTGAQVEVDGAVRFTFEPARGDPFERTRSLSGPMVLVQTGPVDWKVLDATRDGARMSDGIELFKHDAISAHGVTVRLDSLFLFAPSWQFNLVVTNETDAPIVLDLTRAALFAKEGPGRFTRIDGPSTPSLASIPPHTTVEGLLAYPSQDSAEGRILSIAYGSPGARLPAFAFPLQGIVTVPSPAPATSGPVVVSPS